MPKFSSQGLRRWTKLVLGLWDRQYHDSRIILEQQGELRYLVIPARFQRNLARTLLVTVSVTAVLLVGMSGTTAYLQTRKLMLEDSHKEIFMALQSAGINPDTQNGDYTQEDMLEMARTIRERDMQIRQYLGDWTENLASRNDQLRRLVKSSGLNEKVISIIQGNQKVGGVSESLRANPLLSSAFAKETAINSELKSVLEALPEKMPLEEYVITSDFGIRKHPIDNKPSLHAGIDLIPLSNKDSVRAVKPGKVTIARYHGHMGNTVIVRHDRGLETLYGHLDKILVKEGQEVAEDTILGIVGNTGQSTGKHLHFEVLIGSYQVDPKKVVQTAQNVRKIEK
jgi:murein DD-endopeptidase MepM/ murein hydrolase activator NlpD